MCLFHHKLSAAADGCYNCCATFVLSQADMIATLPKIDDVLLLRADVLIPSQAQCC
jgi:hypothetical protein